MYSIWQLLTTWLPDRIIKKVKVKRDRREYNKKWREKNKEHRKQYRQLYNEQNKDKKAKWDKTYYHKHKSSIQERFSKWYSDNQQRLVDKQFLYSKSIGGIYTQVKRSAKKRNKKVNISKEEFTIWWKKQEQKCYYCGKTLHQVINDNDTMNNCRTRLTIDRKDNDKPYEVSNIVLACYRCNMIKSNFFTEKEMLEIGKIIKNKQ